MKIRHLQLFVAVSQARSFSRAAARLGLSQPALSRAIRELESQHKSRLFERTGRGVRLNEAGKVFHSHAIRILGEYDSLLAQLDRLRDEPSGEINVSIPLRIGQLIMVPLIKRCTARFPNASIHVFENLNLQTQEKLVSGAVDIGVFYAPPSPPGLVCELLGNEELYVVGRPDALPASGDTMSMAEAARLPLILQAAPAHFRGFVDKCFQDAGLTPNIARQLETIDALLSFSIEGDGVTILPYSSVLHEVERGEIIAKKITEPKIQRDILIATHSHSPSRLVRETVAQIKLTIQETCHRARWNLSD